MTQSESSDPGASNIDRSADAMFRNYDEAKLWVEDADLWNYPVILEDHFNGNHVATARIRGRGDSYRVDITNHGEQGSATEHTVDGVEVAEMMGGWMVAGREGVANE